MNVAESHKDHASEAKTNMSAEKNATGIPYPVVDEFLGEQLFPDEAALTEQLADTIEKGVRAQYQSCLARRDVHTKATGILTAEFRVNDSLPETLAKGVFIPGKSY